jgi:hypothetical protein
MAWTPAQCFFIKTLNYDRIQPNVGNDDASRWQFSDWRFCAFFAVLCFAAVCVFLVCVSVAVRTEYWFYPIWPVTDWASVPCAASCH